MDPRELDLDGVEVPPLRRLQCPSHRFVQVHVRPPHRRLWSVNVGTGSMGYAFQGYPHGMILEISTESIRDIAAAVNAARKREPDIEIIAALERKVLVAIQQKSQMIELETQEAQSLRNVLMQRAYDQRRTTEATDYSDLADRISNALESEGQLITLESEQES
jgi:hypothetical protein